MLRYNREVATMRGLMTGDFSLMSLMYKKKDNKPSSVSITLIDVNSHKELYKMKTTLTTDGQVGLVLV